MQAISQELPAERHLWAPVGFEHLPHGLVAAFRNGDWPQVRIRLQTVMDAMITDRHFAMPAVRTSSPTTIRATRTTTSNMVREPARVLA
jgi:hypothetical protein